MEHRPQRRFGARAVLALFAFALVLLLSPAQHEDFRPDSVPGHCHACTATPVAALALDVAQGLRGGLPPSGLVVSSSEQPAAAAPVRARAGRAPPEQP